jgi:hypothetical protein
MGWNNSNKCMMRRKKSIKPVYPLTFPPPPAKMKETQSGLMTGHAGE